MNIDLVRHGAELAAFLRAHGLVGGGSGAQLPAEGSGTVCDELSGTVGGERLTCRYVPSADRRLIPVVYRSQVRPLLRAAVNKALLSLHGGKGTSAPGCRGVRGDATHGSGAPPARGTFCGIARTGGLRTLRTGHVRSALPTALLVRHPLDRLYTLHHGTVVVRYIGTEAKAEKK